MLAPTQVAMPTATPLGRFDAVVPMPRFTFWVPAFGIPPSGVAIGTAVVEVLR